MSAITTLAYDNRNNLTSALAPASGSGATAAQSTARYVTPATGIGGARPTACRAASTWPPAPPTPRAPAGPMPMTPSVVRTLGGPSAAGRASVGGGRRQQPANRQRCTHPAPSCSTGWEGRVLSSSKHPMIPAHPPAARHSPVCESQGQHMLSQRGVQHRVAGAVRLSRTWKGSSGRLTTSALARGLLLGLRSMINETLAVQRGGVEARETRVGDFFHDQAENELVRRYFPVLATVVRRETRSARPSRAVRLALVFAALLTCCAGCGPPTSDGGDGERACVTLVPVSTADCRDVGEH